MQEKYPIQTARMPSAIKVAAKPLFSAPAAAVFPCGRGPGPLTWRPATAITRHAMTNSTADNSPCPETAPKLRSPNWIKKFFTGEDILPSCLTGDGPILDSKKAQAVSITVKNPNITRFTGRQTGNPDLCLHISNTSKISRLTGKNSYLAQVTRTREHIIHKRPPAPSSRAANASARASSEICHMNILAGAEENVLAFNSVRKLSPKKAAAVRATVSPAPRRRNPRKKIKTDIPCKNLFFHKRALSEYPLIASDTQSVKSGDISLKCINPCASEKKFTPSILRSCSLSYPLRGEINNADSITAVVSNNGSIRAAAGNTSPLGGLNQLRSRSHKK